MKYGFVMPHGSARSAAALAQAAEQSGWDGFFVWEPVWGIDAWVCLTAAAMRTERIRLGTMLTPLSRMRPWRVAGQAATLDHLSGGRVILSVGLGATDTGFAEFGEVTDRKTRAELLDEGLDILNGLWRGQPFRYQGKHYQVSPASFFPPPPPVQQPRIPIWVVGAWNYPRSMQRVLRCDGLLPYIPGQQLTPAAISEMRAYVEQNRRLTTPFEIVVEGHTPGEHPRQAAEQVRPWQEAGATWWIEADWELPNDQHLEARLLDRLRQGPPGGHRST